MKLFIKTLSAWLNRTFNRPEIDLRDFEKLESKKYIKSVKQRQIDHEVKHLNDPLGPCGGI